MSEIKYVYTIPKGTARKIHSSFTTQIAIGIDEKFERWSGKDFLYKLDMYKIGEPTDCSLYEDVTDAGEKWEAVRLHILSHQNHFKPISQQPQKLKTRWENIEL